MTTATVDKTATKAAAKVNTKVTEAAAKPIEVTVKKIGSTGLMSGIGEMFKFESSKDGVFYAINPEHAFRITPDQWEAMSAMMVPISNIEAQKQAAIEQALKPDIEHIVGFTLSIKDEIQPCTDVTYDTLLKMLEKHNVKLEDMSFTIAPSKAGKKGAKRTGGQSGSNMHKASSYEELRPLGDKALAVAKAMYAEKTNQISLDRWSEFGYPNRQSFVDSRVNDWCRKGYNEACSAAAGNFTLYPDRMYSGFSLNHAIECVKQDKAE